MLLKIIRWMYLLLMGCNFIIIADNFLPAATTEQTVTAKYQQKEWHNWYRIRTDFTAFYTHRKNYQQLQKGDKISLKVSAIFKKVHVHVQDIKRKTPLYYLLLIKFWILPLVAVLVSIFAEVNKEYYSGIFAMTLGIIAVYVFIK